MKHRILSFALGLTKYLLVFFLLLVFLCIVGFSYLYSTIDYSIEQNQKIDVYDRNGKFFFSLTNNKNQTFVSLDDINQDTINAFITIEDKKFYSHKGIDLKRISSALINNVKAKYFKEGASTITQQYVRNLYLTNTKSIKRKIDEALIAIDIERKLTKDEILEGYLNTIYFGHGIYGINDASYFFFNKRPKDLSLNEACSLAATIKGPTLYSPLNNFQRNSNRRKLILSELFKDNLISESEFKKYYNEDIKIVKKFEDTSRKLEGYYKDKLIDEIRSLELDLDNNGNLKLYSYIDLDFTNIIEDIYENEIPSHLNDIEVSLIAIDNSTRGVVSLIGGKDYNTSTFNRALYSLRQPASCVKPFLYYKALEKGFTTITTIHSSKTTFNYTGSTYAPSNFGDIYPNCDVTLAYALATSDNMYAIKTHMFLGIDSLYNIMKDLKFTTPINKNLSLALGTSEVYFYELVNAYCTLATLGQYDTLKYISHITNGRDIVYETKSNKTKVLDSSITYILNETMTNVFDNNLKINISVTGNYVSDMLNAKFASKSGSTDFDNYMIGFNNEITIGVWCGYDNNTLIDNSETKFIKRIWARAITKYMDNFSDSTIPNWYQTPDDVISININPTYGKMKYNDIYSKDMYFKIDNIPWYIYDKTTFD